MLQTTFLCIVEMVLEKSSNMQHIKFNNNIAPKILFLKHYTNIEKSCHCIAEQKILQYK